MQTKFLAVGSCLGHLSIKKIFQIGPTVLALKLDNLKREGAGGGNPPPPPPMDLFTDFYNHEDDIQS